MTGSRVLGTGAYVPDDVITNADLERLLDTSDEWITQRTGVRERRRAAPGTATSDLGLEAARRALGAAGVTPGQIDLIVFCTITPDTHCPSAACWLQGKLGATRAVAFDVNAACSGFLYGLTVADAWLRTRTAQRALVVAGETMTRAADYSDRRSCILWGDGAGAVVLGRAEGTHGAGRVLSTHLHSDGTQADMLQYPGGGSSVSPISEATARAGVHWIKMSGREAFKVAVRAFTDVCREALHANQLPVERVRWLIPHQANLRIIEAVAKQLDCPLERVYLTIHKYGNISSATVPIALDEAVRGGHVKRGDLVLLAAFGGGVAWGSSLIEW